MRAIFLHAEYAKIIPKKIAIKNNYDKDAKDLEIKKDHLIIFSCFEEGDNESVVNKALDEIKRYCNQMKIKTVLVYPWAHLSKKLCAPKLAKELLDKLYNKLKREKFETYKAPFGWYKEFNIKVKGHPLAELSREFKPEIEKKEVEHTFYVIYPDGKIEEVDENLDLNKFDKGFQILIKKEALKEPYPEIDDENKNILLKSLKKFGFEWEPWSDYGHMRYGPLATEIYKAVEEYAREVIKSFSKRAKIKIYEIKGTNFFKTYIFF
jgi:threonyl-tRNA synthetase